jgi:hypothetical protein
LFGICCYFGIGCCVDRTEAAEVVRIALDEGNALEEFKHGV